MSDEKKEIIIQSITWLEKAILGILISIFAYLWVQHDTRIAKNTDDIQQSRLYIAQHYVNKSDYQRDMNKIDKKLDMILKILMKNQK